MINTVRNDNIDFSSCMKANGKLFSLYKNFALLLSQSKIGNLQIVASLHSLIISFLQPEAVEVEGNKLFLDRGDSLRLSIKRIHDPVQTSLTKKYVKEGDVIIDVGAHIGYYTLIFANLVSQNGRVFAFEPSPDNFKLLKKNVALNNYQNVTLVNTAVGNKSGHISLYLSKTSQADHKTYDDGNLRKSLQVQSTTLDDYFSKFKGEINFVKIDVQGAEAAVIDGMRKIIKANRRIKILTEYWPFGMAKTGVKPDQYLKLLAELGFRLIDINEYTNQIHTYKVNQFLKKYTIANTIVTNILCVRN